MSVIWESDSTELIEAMLMLLKRFRIWLFLFMANKKISNLIRNRFDVDALLRGKSKIRIAGKNNAIEIKNGKLKNVRIGIDGSGNIIRIDKNVQIGSLEIIVQGSDCVVHIGRNTQIGGARIVCCENGNKVIIGDDNLIAEEVEFWSCDGHSIYQNGNRINPSKPILVADRVWIGRHVKILKGVTIHPDTVIGMGSLVTAREYPAGVLLAGFPAKVIREEITWNVERTPM